MKNTVCCKHVYIAIMFGLALGRFEPRGPFWPVSHNKGFRVCRWCWERFPHHQLQKIPRVSDAGMHHGMYVPHMPWCMLGSLTRGVRVNVPGIPGACATLNFTYLTRGPCSQLTNCWISLVIVFRLIKITTILVMIYSDDFCMKKAVTWFDSNFIKDSSHVYLSQINHERHL